MARPREAPVPRPLGPRGCSRPRNSSRQRAVELTRRSRQLAVRELSDSCWTDRTVDSDCEGIADRFFASLFGGTLLYHRFPLSWYHLGERRSPQKYLGERRSPAFPLDYTTDVERS